MKTTLRTELYISSLVQKYFEIREQLNSKLQTEQEFLAMIDKHERENKDLKDEVKRLNVLLDSVENNMNQYIQNRETILNVPKSFDVKTRGKRPRGSD